MGKKRSSRSIQDKPEIFCFYCDREFDDERILIQHQKLKHFKCDFCNKKLATVGGLVIHCTQVHKEPITKVPNAIPEREKIEYDVFGMAGIPDEFLSENAKIRKRMEMANSQPGLPIPTFVPPFPGAFPMPPPLPPRPPMMPLAPPPPPLPPNSGLAPPLPVGLHPPMPVPPSHFPPPPPMMSFQSTNPIAYAPFPPMPPISASIPLPPGSVLPMPVPLQPMATHIAQSMTTLDVKLIWNDDEFSIEERRAQLPKYRMQVTT